MDTWDEIRAERTELAELLGGLAPQQWDTQTLCDEWRVRDAVAHLILGTRAKVGGFLVGMVRNGFNFNRTLAKEAVAIGGAPTEQTLGDFRSIISSQGKFPMATPLNVLTDTLVHQQDIRRPLGMARAVPEERAIAVADGLKKTGFPFGTKKRIAGLRLVATDADWSTGDGPEVSGSIEALVMMMANRPAALADLKGEGLDILTART